jgi:hypothetical protein
LNKNLLFLLSGKQSQLKFKKIIIGNFKSKGRSKSNGRGSCYVADAFLPLIIEMKMFVQLFIPSFLFRNSFPSLDLFKGLSIEPSTFTYTLCLLFRKELKRFHPFFFYAL